MTDIDIHADLQAINKQLEALVEELQQLDSRRQVLAQQVQNLNGVAMYLRGKTEDASTDAAEDSESNNKET